MSAAGTCTCCPMRSVGGGGVSTNGGVFGSFTSCPVIDGALCGVIGCLASATDEDVVDGDAFALAEDAVHEEDAVDGAAPVAFTLAAASETLPLRG